MRLSKLELQGFKSFADATAFVFEPGVTAIVGPNGCGKSNVSDAVRWVLGEQRARLLRGARMEEVIFQGSSARRAVNVAEVSLHFDNDEGILPVPYSEVVITRRLGRSGESEYLLNRTPCRLRDIEDLLRGTGLATDAGVVIESRMIDALLSDRPDERRELFEEAAGVSLYRDRRRSTERRLEETTVDLQRLNDLISEVQSQVRSLTRQRRRAERFTELTQRRFTVEITQAARAMAGWREELASLEARRANLREQLPRSGAEVRLAEETRDAAHGTRTVADAMRSELGHLVASERDEVSKLQGEVAVAEERQRNSDLRRRRAEEERQEGKEQGSRLDAERERAREECARLQCELEEVSEELARWREKENGARQDVDGARSLVQQADQQVRDAQDHERRLEHDRERVQRENDELARRIEPLDAELSHLRDTVALAQREHESATAELDGARASAVRSDALLEAARVAVADARDRESAARSELLRVDHLHGSLLGRVSALETLERERVGLAPAAAFLLRERGRFGEGAILGPVSDFIGADEEAAPVVERYLGATLHAVIVRDRTAADEVRRWHADADPGPLLLLPLDAAPADAAPFDRTAAAATPPDAGSPPPPDRDALIRLVDAQAPALAWIRALLGGVTPIDTGSAFLDARGAIWLPGNAGGPGPLRRRAELFSRRAELGESENELRDASTRAGAMRDTLAEAEGSAALTGEAAAAAHHALRNAKANCAELDRRAARERRELSEADALSERLVARIEQLRARSAEIERAVADLAGEIERAGASLVAARTRLAAAEQAQDAARDLRTQSQVEEAQTRARVEVSGDRERRLASELAVTSARLDSLRAELAVLSDADAALAARIADWRARLQARQDALAESEARLAATERAVADADAEFTRAEHALDEMRRTAHALGEELHHAELRYTDLSGRRSAVRERLEAEWRRPLEEMLASTAMVEINGALLQEEADSIRRQLETLGPVNPMAIEEHEDEVKRLDFLTGQRDDLAAARDSLQLAIREIDATARELFLTTFAAIQENFHRIFLTLFGGGECDLRLENPDSPLDCDIEIHASPRGKRTQRIHLLSSGERALVALSLLFGIFLTKPSPFCLLDEVDAPLDDANIGRFVRMLNEFKARTQFIVITHNPRTTTEAADAVFGVTMQEPGVSSLVAVRMRETLEGDVADEGAGVVALPA
ncbi:MAG: chromosome segregation protein SMC [Gemmatimonadaceae bacterium]